jgi:hypothetical protein
MRAVKELIGLVIVVPGTLMIIAGVLTIGGQIVHYLRVGYWTPVTVLQALQEIGLWVGVQKMIDGFLGLPFGAVSLIAGIVIYWIGFRIAMWIAE